MDKDKVITFGEELDSLSNGLSIAKQKINTAADRISNTGEIIDHLRDELLEIPGVMIPVNDTEISNDLVEPINDILDSVIDPKYKGDFSLSAVDVIVAIVSGVIASIIDIVFVGTPEVVKLYRGGENFDGSILTAALRKIGNGDEGISDITKWLSHKCVVPYDVSNEPGIVIPNNHRLRNPGHDPLIGLLFAVADILLGTATLIDNEGNVRIIVRDKDYPPQEKILSVVYYLGHLLSDLCTARGLPIPGFVLTQFFTSGESENSIAKVAEGMYLDGYDLRHLASMSTPVAVKNMVIDAYIYLFNTEDSNQFETIAEKEIHKNRSLAYKYRMRLVSDAVCCGGNVLKFFIPPTTGNITALNLPEWTSLITDTIAEAKYQLRDKSVEEALFNREIIQNNWEQLMKQG